MLRILRNFWREVNEQLETDFEYTVGVASIIVIAGLFFVLVVVLITGGETP